MYMSYMKGAGKAKKTGFKNLAGILLFLYLLGIRTGRLSTK